MSKLCKKCNRYFTDNVKYCPECGTKVLNINMYELIKEYLRKLTNAKIKGKSCRNIHVEPQEYSNDVFENFFKVEKPDFINFDICEHWGDTDFALMLETDIGPYIQHFRVKATKENLNILKDNVPEKYEKLKNHYKEFVDYSEKEFEAAKKRVKEIKTVLKNIDTLEKEEEK